jgi:Carboxypeptidase regulatory-like domain/TonB-dependent Receptor Plug Domain
MSCVTQLRLLQHRRGRWPSSLRLLAHLIILTTVFVLVQDNLLAQAPQGAIRGIVNDVTGAVAPKTSLRVSQLQFGGGRVVATDAYGRYYITNLEPGDYEIEAFAPGFKTEVKHVTLRVGDHLTINFQLHPGSVDERVLVSGQTSGINTSEFAVNGSVNQLQIQSLPLNGRNFLELARLEPGVSVVSVTNPGTFANNYSRVSIAGAQYLLTQVSVDGVTVSDRMNGGTAQNFSQETVQEFEVERFSFDPASAMSGTGGISIVSRRGNNNLHGAAFFFYRDHNMAAYPGLHRDPEHPDPFFARKQSGFRLGGPLRKDRVFWFTNFEHDWQTAALAVQNNHPIFSKLDVVYPSPLTFNQFNLRIDGKLDNANTAFVRVSQDKNNNVAPASVGIFMPSNWVSNRNSALQIAGGETAILNSHIVNDLRYAYSYLHSRANPVTSQNCADPVVCVGVGGPEILPFDDPAFHIGNRPAAPLAIFPTTNQLLDVLTWQHNRHLFRLGADWEHVSLHGYRAIYEPAQMTLWGPTNLLQSPSLYNALPASLKDPTGPPPTLGDILQLPLRSFITGIGNVSFPGPYHSDSTSHSNLWRFHAQDSWSTRGSLTLTFGAAYSYQTNIYNKDLKRPPYLAPIFGGDLRPPHRGASVIDPSAGLAWNVQNKGKTVIRGGGGIYHDKVSFFVPLLERGALGPSGNQRVPVDGSVVGISFLSTPTAFRGQDLLPMLPTIRSTLASKVGNGTDPTVTTVQVVKQADQLFDPNHTTGYAIHVNGGIQQELTPSLTLSVDYVMRRYVHLGGFQGVFSIDRNQFNRPRVTGVDPSTGVVSFVRDPVIPLCTPTQAKALNPQDQCSTGAITVHGGNANFRYQALQMKLDKRFSSRLQFTGSYALAKNTGFVAVTQYNNPALDYGNVGTPRHTLIVSGVYEVPDVHTQSRLLRGLLTAWTVAFISETDSAPPIDTMLSGLDLDGDGISTTLLPGINAHNLFGQGLNQSKLRDLVAQYNASVEARTRTITNPDGTQSVIRPRTPFNQIISPIVLPGNISPGDSFISQDVRLTKRFNIKEKVTVSLIGEVFNLFNVANLTGYSNVLNQPNYGQPSARAGQAFGTGGPRAFQVAARVEF